jgi:hypothetical protein
MKAWLKRLALSFIVTLSFAAHKLPAQAPLVPPSQPFDTHQSSPLVAIMARPPDTTPRKHPILNSCGYGCGSDLNWYGCGGPKALLQMYFGSCRTFFGESCAVPQHPSIHNPRLLANAP